MNYVAVSSSNITAIAYDGAGRVRGVQFLNGREYLYRGVARSVCEGLWCAGSKGGYFNSFVKDAYACTRVGWRPCRFGGGLRRAGASASPN